MILRYLKIILVLTSILLTSSFTQASNKLKSEEDSISILLIGNSMLGWHFLADKLDSLIKHENKNCYVDHRVRGGWSLEDHLNDDYTKQKIRSRNWNYVLLQGGTMELSKHKWHDHVIPYILELQKIIEDNNPDTETLFMLPIAYEDGLTWVEGETDDYRAMQKNLYDATIKLGYERGISIVPVGWAWFKSLNLFDKNVKLDLWEPDFVHPTNQGTYLICCTLHSFLFQDKLDSVEYFEDVDEDVAYYLQNISSDVVIDNLDLWINLEPTIVIGTEHFQSNDFQLSQNYPNPFSKSTSINFTLNKPGYVKIQVFNSLGQLNSIPINRFYATGDYIVNISLNNSEPGIYFYQMQIDNYTTTRKMVYRK